MRTPYLSVLFSTLAILAATAQGEDQKKSQKITAKHYRIYDSNGHAVSWQAMLHKLQSAQVIFLGESHDDPVAHHLQAKIFKKLHQSCKKPSSTLALSLEMFERDVQHIVDEYLAGLITEQHFLAGSRPWKHYKDDYRALVEYAKKHNLAVIAANAPRRYVNRVGRLGADSLQQIPSASQRGLPPLPYGKASPTYTAKFKDIMEKMRKEHADKAKKKKHKHAGKKTSPPKDKKKTPGHSSHKKTTPRTFDLKKSLQAQSLWDAAMAYSIAEHLLKAPATQVLHLNGSFHTDSRLGIPEHLRRYRPGTTFLVVTILPEKSFPRFDCKEMTGRGDFVIVTDPALQRKTKRK